MVRGEGLQVLQERMKTLDPDENEIYKFLGIEQADDIRTKTVFEKVKEEVSKRVKMMANTELNDANLIKAINMKVIPVAANTMNICSSMSVSWRNWMRWLRENSKERTYWESRKAMKGCTWRERKVEDDWSCWGIRTRTQDCVLPATWPSLLVSGLKLHGEDRRSRMRKQSFWNQWRWWRKLEWDCALKGNR